MMLSGNMKEITIEKPVTRYEILRVMNYLIKSTTDEDIYEIWIQSVPDQVTDEELKEISEDSEDFKDIVETFLKLSKYLKSGVKIEGEWYGV